MLCNGAFLEGNPVTSDYKVSNSECFMHKSQSSFESFFIFASLVLPVFQPILFKICRAYNKIAQVCVVGCYSCTVEPLTNDHPHQRPSLSYDDISCDGQWFLFVYESLTSDHPSHPLIRPHQCDSEGGRIRRVLLYVLIHRHVAVLCDFVPIDMDIVLISN